MIVTILTSSRADYGILRPLISKLDADSFFELHLVVFGTHNSEFHGNTIREIENDQTPVFKKISTPFDGDSPKAISDIIGNTYLEFSKFWAESNTDLILCLGDRYEMFAAVGAAVPFNIPIGHISGGEITEGAIDNIYRNSLTLMSTYHFASCEVYRENIVRITDINRNAFNVGALNFDNLTSMEFYSKNEFNDTFNIELKDNTILITLHPETISFEKNEEYVIALISALEDLSDYRQLITMPNADTSGVIIRNKILEYSSSTKNTVFIVESLGWKGYLSAMKHCKFMLGNTSSGFVEASFFPKKVINLGDRQKGRLVSNNIFNTPITKTDILKAVQIIESSDISKFSSLYGDGTASEKIVTILKELN